MLPARVSIRAIVAPVLLALALAAPHSIAGQGTGFNPALPLIHVDNGANSPHAQAQHYVVLVSLDGFRWDYAKRDNAIHLLALGKRGVWAPEGMLPSYPSLTFPNHFTIVTGLYPEHHGLVANSFLDPASGKRYSIGNSQAVTDSSFYSGTPLWSLAESQGMHAACLYWPGSEAKIAGFRPSWYAQFSKTESTAEVQQARIDDAVALLRLPPDQRPHFITIYYSEPDHEGHEFGPDAPETRAAERKVDGLVGKLKAALDQFADLTGFDTAGPLLYGKTEEDRERVYNQLKRVSAQFVVYRLKNVPADLEINQNPREGDPVVIATGPYPIRAHALPADSPNQSPEPGMHGFDPRKVPQMKASFFAAGPDIVKGKTVAPFENVNLYPWLAHLLGLTSPSNDGSLNILAGTLRDRGETPGTSSDDQSGNVPPQAAQPQK